MGGVAEGAAQHSKPLDKLRELGRTLSAQSPTAMVEQMKERIHNIAQDMPNLNRSWREELVRFSLVRARRPAPKKRRRAQRKRVRPFEQLAATLSRRRCLRPESALGFTKDHHPAPLHTP